MSCDTLNSQSVGLNVAIGNLPEGFCPASMQELAQAIAARLIVTPSQSFNGMAIGSTEPTSNVGLWFKNCEELFVFDDATGRYVPLRIRGAFQSLQYFTASNTFIVPEFITQLRVQGWGGGGGGGYDAGGGRGGAGGGGYGMKIFTVLPGQSIGFTVGAGGAGGSPGTAGGNTTFLTMTCGGGQPSREPTFFGGAGGVTTGADIPITGQTGQFASAGAAAGSGGDSPRGGGGGSCSDTSTSVGIVPGGGGAGGIAAEPAGNGAGGGLQIEY